MTFRALWHRFSDYFDSRDGRTRFGNTIAMIVVGNQPFYPFYVWYAADATVGASFLTWLSAPFFLAAPWLARRQPVAGRLTLLGASLGNTVLSAVALGPASGIELFYLPCLLLAWFGSPPRDRRLTLPIAITVAALGLYAARFVDPLAALADGQQHSLRTMHAISVACLMAVMGYMAFRMPATLPLNRSDASPTR